MTLQEFENIYEEIADRTANYRLRAAFDSMRRLSSEPTLSRFAAEADALEQRYFYMLRFLNSSSPFPSAGAETKSIADSLMHLADRMERAFRTAHDPHPYYARLRFQEMRPEETVESLFADYLDEQKRLATDPQALTDTGRRARLEQLASDIFLYIWTAPNLSADQADTISAMLSDSDIPAYDREMWTGAIGLSASTDPRRYSILADMYASADERISAAALVWICLDMMKYSHYSGAAESGLSEIFRSISDSRVSDIMIFVLEYLRVIATPPKADDKTLLNDLRDMGASMADRLGNASDSDDALRRMDRLMADMPEGYFDKLKNFSEAQMRGDDVYAGSIGRMRAFPFFRQLPVWLLPFHLDRSELASVVDSEGVGMATILEKLPMLCDSDKYALVLSLANVPDNIRSGMLAETYTSLSQLSQTDEGAEMMKVLEAKQTLRAAVNNYLKNIARILASFQGADSLGIPRDSCDAVRLMALRDEELPEGYAAFADAVAALGFHEDAANLYIPLQHDCSDPAMLCRMARVNAKSGNLTVATSLYLRAVANGDNSLETAMALARVMLDDEYTFYSDEDGSIPKPIDVLEPHMAEGTDNPELLSIFAEACTAADDYHRAAETYYNLNYVLPQGDNSAKLPLARALLMCGDGTGAHDVLTPLVSTNPTIETLLVDGIALWESGARDKAVETIMQALPLCGGDFATLGKKVCDEISCFARSRDTISTRNTSMMLLPDILAYKVYGSRFGSLG